MKKQSILAVALALSLTAGTAFTAVGGVQTFADKNTADAQQTVTCQAADEQCDFEESTETFASSLVKAGTISQAEADRLIENDKKIEQLFNEYDQLTEQNEAQLDQKIEQIEKEVADIYQKIEHASQAAYYNELSKNNVLNKAEIEQLKALEAQIEALYSNADSDQAFTAAEAEADKLYEANKALFDKIDVYYEQQMQQEADQMYQEMIDSGELTAAQVEQLKVADQQADKLLEQAGDDLTDEEWEQLDQKIDALYETLDF